MRFGSFPHELIVSADSLAVFAQPSSAFACFNNRAQVNRIPSIGSHAIVWIQKITSHIVVVEEFLRKSSVNQERCCILICVKQKVALVENDFISFSTKKCDKNIIVTFI